MKRTPNLQRFACLGHHLHDANRADPAAGGLVEARLLITLRRHQHPVEIVLRTVLLEHGDDRVKTGGSLLGRRRRSAAATERAQTYSLIQRQHGGHPFVRGVSRATTGFD